jgi:FixJ family two-component response regulator
MQAISHGRNFPTDSRSFSSHIASPPFNLEAASIRPEVVYLVDQDPGALKEISAPLATLEVTVLAFTSVAEYLAHSHVGASSCLVLELQLTNRYDLDWQCQIAEEARPPVVFICSQIDIPSAVRVVKAGAIELLTKPVDPAALVEAVLAALAHDRKLRQRRAELTELKERLARLTPREREVLPLIVGGLLNKQAASALGISEVTLQIHRSQVMRKMQAESLAELVRMAMKLRIPYLCDKRARLDQPTYQSSPGSADRKSQSTRAAL